MTLARREGGVWTNFLAPLGNAVGNLKTIHFQRGPGKEKTPGTGGKGGFRGSRQKKNP